MMTQPSTGKQRLEQLQQEHKIAMMRMKRLGQWRRRMQILRPQYRRLYQSIDSQTIALNLAV